MKLDILFHYEVNEQTGEITYIGKEEISVDTKATKSATKTSTKASAAKVDANPDPIITLDSNKLILTQGAVDLLQVCADCRVDIKYKKKDKKAVPIIGTDAAFGTKSGNKLTKSNTVSYRGAANEKLSAYGTTFKLEPTEDKGIYYLVGDKIQEENSVPDEIIDIENELDIESLDNINIDEDDKDLEKFDFNLN
ncbi:hypothetical protein [Catenibacterium sp.]|jgi:hypothetical protein|uniref:hypothetical protein n=1 Tax=Catenibacterium sp. TaxID=2049022 RepID=UPI00220391E3|nr:hypothetical protein [Catenibacterium sp.]MEE0820990.1 hypothetical protein [Catenibacterium sp.]UWI21526.1 MAG: hypothetical protein [Bacteriophage sp.]